MGAGAVQEEILLMIHPESLLGRALFEPMADSGACVVMGAVRVSEYSGYGRGGRFGNSAFAYARSVQFDHRQRLDKDGRALTEILAFNATNFSKTIRAQYGGQNINHEYERAAAAFSTSPFTDAGVPITTGLWGSGDFGGDPVLKSLLQVAAACATNRKLYLVLVGDKVKKAVDEIMVLAETLTLSVTEFVGAIIQGVRAQTYGTDRAKNASLTAAGVRAELKKIQQQKIKMATSPSSSLGGSDGNSSSSTLSAWASGGGSAYAPMGNLGQGYLGSTEAVSVAYNPSFSFEEQENEVTMKTGDEDTEAELGGEEDQLTTPRRPKKQKKKAENKE